MTTGLCAGDTVRAGGYTVVAPMTRRQLLTWSATAAVAATLPATQVVAAPDGIGQARWLRRGSYTGRIGERFQALLADGRRVSLRLAAVENLIGTSPGGKSLKGSDASFLLEFHGPGKPQLEQGVHELRHRAFGRGTLFIVPQRPASNRSRYAVVVNRGVR